MTVSSFHVDADACERAGIPYARVRQLARALSALGREADELGIVIFGGSGRGTLRPSRAPGTQNVLAILLTGNFDGGDGGDEFGETL